MTARGHLPEDPDLAVRGFGPPADAPAGDPSLDPADSPGRVELPEPVALGGARVVTDRRSRQRRWLLVRGRGALSLDLGVAQSAPVDASGTGCLVVAARHALSRRATSIRATSPTSVRSGSVGRDCWLLDVPIATLATVTWTVEILDRRNVVIESLDLKELLPSTGQGRRGGRRSPAPAGRPDGQTPGTSA